jgi:hypothetical protein
MQIGSIDVRDIERLMILANIAGSLLAGLLHDGSWFVLLVGAQTLHLVLMDRALRRQIGARHWPSEGYARFTFNTNLYFAFRQLLLAAVLFASAGTLSGLFGA